MRIQPTKNKKPREHAHTIARHTWKHGTPTMLKAPGTRQARYLELMLQCNRPTHLTNNQAQYPKLMLQCNRPTRLTEHFGTSTMTSQLTTSPHNRSLLDRAPASQPSHCCARQGDSIQNHVNTQTHASAQIHSSQEQVPTGLIEQRSK